MLRVDCHRGRAWLLAWLICAGLANFAEVGSAPVNEAEREKSERHRVDALCSRLRQYAKTPNSKPRVFADMSDEVRPTVGKGQWREFPTIKALESAAKGQVSAGFNTSAYIWSLRDTSMLVFASFQSRSGDWAHFVEYCYRRDGTLARSESTLNTVYARDGKGPVHRVRVRYYDLEGRILHTSATVSDLDTKKSDPTRQFDDQEEPLYTSKAALPFFKIAK